MKFGDLSMCEKYSYKICDDGLEESIDILGADEEIFVPNDIITEENVKKIVKLLNEQNKQIKELGKDRDFWKYNCVSQDNLNAILNNELELARKEGYSTSDAFNKYRKYVKKTIEWNKQFLNGDKDD